MSKFYTVECKETWNVFATASTLEEAEKILAQFEQEDLENGYYSDDYYLIYYKDEENGIDELKSRQ